MQETRLDHRLELVHRQGYDDCSFDGEQLDLLRASRYGTKGIFPSSAISNACDTKDIVRAGPIRKSAMQRAVRVADQAQIRTEFSMPRERLVDTYFLIRVSCQGCYITFLFPGRKGKNPNSDGAQPVACTALLALDKTWQGKKSIWSLSTYTQSLVRNCKGTAKSPHRVVVCAQRIDEMTYPRWRTRSLETITKSDSAACQIHAKYAKNKSPDMVSTERSFRVTKCVLVELKACRYLPREL